MFEPAVIIGKENDCELYAPMVIGEQLEPLPTGAN